jgi:hypothetical protein
MIPEHRTKAPQPASLQRHSAKHPPLLHEVQVSIREFFSTAVELLLIATMLPIGQSQAPSIVSLAPPQIPVPASYFGLHLHLYTPETWAQVPFSELRLWDLEDAIWYAIEPRKGQWNFSQLDKAC